MTERAALLSAIRDGRDDDLPRLVYADWLDEHSDPDRAEFIRKQIELARLPIADSRRQLLLERCADLLGLHGEQWAHEDLGRLDVLYENSHLGAEQEGESGISRALRVGDLQFRRGFLDHIRIYQGPEARVFDLLNETPVSSLHMTDCTFSLPLEEILIQPSSFALTSMPDLLENGRPPFLLTPETGEPQLAKLRHLSFDAPRPEQLYEDFLAHPQLTGLETLALNCTSSRAFTRDANTERHFERLIDLPQLAGTFIFLTSERQAVPPTLSRHLQLHNGALPQAKLDAAYERGIRRTEPLAASPEILPLAEEIPEDTPPANTNVRAWYNPRRWFSGRGGSE